MPGPIVLRDGDRDVIIRNGQFVASGSLDTYISLIASSGEIADIVIENCSFDLSALSGDLRRGIWGYSGGSDAAIRRVTIRNCKFFGGDPTVPRVDGVAFNWPKRGDTEFGKSSNGMIEDIRVIDCDVHDLSGHFASGISLGKPPLDRNRRLAVENCRFHRLDAGRRVVGANVQGKDIVIADCYVHDLGRSFGKPIGDVIGLYTKGVRSVVKRNRLVDAGRQAAIMIKGAGVGSDDCLTRDNIVVFDEWANLGGCGTGIAHFVKGESYGTGNQISTREGGCITGVGIGWATKAKHASRLILLDEEQVIGTRFGVGPFQGGGKFGPDQVVVCKCDFVDCKRDIHKRLETTGC